MLSLPRPTSSSVPVTLLTILRKKRLLFIVNTHSSPTAFHRASVRWQMLVFTCVCSLAKEVKSSYSISTLAASFILSMSGLKYMRQYCPWRNGSLRSLTWYW